MKTSILLEFNSEAEAAAYLAGLAGNGGMSAGSSLPPPPAPGAVPPPPGAASPAPMAPPPAANIAPPPAPPPAPAPAANPLQGQVMKAMQAYSGIHKAAGVRNVMSHLGKAKVTECNDAELAWLLDVFSKMQAVALKA